MGLFSNLFKPAAPVLVVDVVSLNESLGMKGNVSPRSQLQTLRRLSRFSQREKVDVVAVSSGSPLNKAPHGKPFEGIMVLYSKSAEELGSFLARTVRSKGAGAILVTGNVELEKQAGSVQKLRISTFRKAFDLGGDQEPQERGNANAPRGNRPPRKNRQKQQNGDAPRKERTPKERQPKEKERQQQPKEPSRSDAINELIDLVD